MHANTVSEREREKWRNFNGKSCACTRFDCEQCQKIYDLYDRTAANGRSHLIISAFKSVEKFFVDRLRA